MRFWQEAKEKYRSEGLRSLFVDGPSYLLERAALSMKRRLMTYRNDTVVDNRSVAMDFDFPVLTKKMKNSIVGGSFGPKTEWVESIVRDIAGADVDVVEIGAGSGFMSSKIDAEMSENRTHVAVEANPAVLPVLERTKELNGSGYTIVNCAYAVAASTVEFNVYDDFKSGTAKTGRGQADDVIQVPATTLADLRDEFDLETFVLYTNMEGMEFDLIDHEFDVVKKHCPLLVVTFHSFTDHDVDEYVRRLDERFERRWDNGQGTYVYENPTHSSA